MNASTIPDYAYGPPISWIMPWFYYGQIQFVCKITLCVHCWSYHCIKFEWASLFDILYFSCTGDVKPTDIVCSLYPLLQVHRILSVLVLGCAHVLVTSVVDRGAGIWNSFGVGSIKVTLSLNYSRQVHKQWLYMYIRYLRTHWGQSWSGQLHNMHEIDMEFTWTVVGMANAYWPFHPCS